MGCCHSKPKKEKEKPTIEIKFPEQNREIEYSHERREPEASYDYTRRENPKVQIHDEKRQIRDNKKEPVKHIPRSSIVFDRLCDTVVLHKPESIDGQNVVLKHCRDSKIFLLDCMDGVMVDNCSGCQFVFGPIRGSATFNNCKECRCILACRELWTRACTNMDLFLFCETKPTIDSSSQLRFGCCQLAYHGLKQQFRQASLSFFNNNWSDVHDKTPSTTHSNWITLPEYTQMSQIFDLRTTSSENELPFIVSANDSVIPSTLGRRDGDLYDSCFVIVFHHTNASEVALKIIENLKGQLELIQTKEVLLSSVDASKIFGSSSTRIWEAVKKGPIIGMEFNGEDSVFLCSKVVAELQTSQHHLYSSHNTNVAIREIENFYNFCGIRVTG